ncbi:hypothetical protein [Streptomyces scopuliridis]|uniref:hypothetical protein n=1 Tax=Streptomyces scopuliridis TaxID=452529 RepID=UPI00369A3846
MVWATLGAAVITGLFALWVANSGDDDPKAPPSNAASSTSGRGEPSADDGQGEEEAAKLGPATAPAPATVTAIPDAGEIGATIKVQGRGFEPGEVVRIYMDTKRGQRDTTVKSDGTFETEVVIPGSVYSPGSIGEVRAVGLTSDITADMPIRVTG